ncbi:MAG TPA: hypothetical protein VMU34_05655 [Mycobacterium sp.]|nr:hypothetical protein [Mycobacterium sp.]
MSDTVMYRGDPTDHVELSVHVSSMAGFRDIWTLRDTSGSGEVTFTESALRRLRDYLNRLDLHTE